MLHRKGGSAGCFIVSQLYSTHYTAVLINSKSTSVIKVITMENSDGFWKPSLATTKLTLFAVNKDEWSTKEVPLRLKWC